MDTQIYLDHAATTPMRQIARDTWVQHSGLLNPGGQYAAGRAARKVLEDARESVAACLGADRMEVIFTGSGTEADNLAITGLWRARQAGTPRPGIALSEIEHSAVLEPARTLVAEGARTDFLATRECGVIEVPDHLPEDTALIACMMANNETGRIQPIKELCALGQEYNVPVHVDAVQAVGHIPVNFHELGATNLALSAHKFGGPRGIGVLLAKRSPAPTPVLHGGGQERGLRPGTSDVASAAALAAALKEACSQQAEEAASRRVLRDRLLHGIQASIPDVLTMSADSETGEGLPGHVHVCFRGAEGDSLIMLLDSQGIAASTGSACSQGVNRPSHVLLAMGVSEADARGAVRFSLGRTTTEAEVDQLLAVLPGIVEQARAAGMA